MSAHYYENACASLAKELRTRARASSRRAEQADLKDQADVRVGADRFADKLEQLAALLELELN